MKTLNAEEITIGCVFGLALYPIIGASVLLVAPATAILWSLGGAGYGRALRFAGVPAVSFIAMPHTLPYALASVGCGALLTVGYGIPSTQPPDEGSALGRFWYKRSPKLANILTRGTIYLGMLLVYSVAWLASR